MSGERSGERNGCGITAVRSTRHSTCRHLPKTLEGQKLRRRLWSIDDGEVLAAHHANNDLVCAIFLPDSIETIAHAWFQILIFFHACCSKLPWCGTAWRGRVYVVAARQLWVFAEGSCAASIFWRWYSIRTTCGIGHDDFVFGLKLDIAIAGFIRPYFCIWKIEVVVWSCTE